MSDDEIGRFLATQSTVIVIGARPSGAPSGAVGRLEYEDGALAFVIHDDDPIVAVLAADDRACCVVEQFPSYYQIAGVMLHGRAKRRGGAAPGEARFDLTVDKVVSFDFAKLLTTS
jgi:hypothetical protein